MVERRDFAFQIAFRADWTSPNTPLAARKMVTTPISVATRPDMRSLALRIMACVRLRGLAPHQAAQLVDDRALRRLLAEDAGRRRQ